MKKITALCFILLFSFLASAQDKKTLNILRTNKPPKIDGILNDLAWKDADSAKNFTQLRPEMGPTLPKKRIKKPLLK